MSKSKYKIVFVYRWSAIFFVILLGASGWAIGGCKKQSSKHASNVRRYYLSGKVVSVDKEKGMLVVNAQAIPGFMDAMTMPYSVRDPNALNGISPGDEIGADVVVDQEGAYLENILVMKKRVGASPQTEFHAPQPGEAVPDFMLIDQDGERIHLNSFRGHVLLVTFIYTRCPFSTFCPLVSHHFADIYAETKKDPKLSESVRLLTLTFDPKHDTPAVLRRYGESFRATTGGIPFDRWVFAAAPMKELPALAHFFGLTYTEENGTIVHSLSTTVITPEGKVYKWYDDNSWQPSDLVAEATQVLDENPSTASHTHAPKISSATGR